MVAPELAERVIARALARGGDLGELYAEDRRDFRVALDDGRVEDPRAGAERGASVRVVRGEASYFGHVDGIDEASLIEVADSVAQAVRGDERRPRGLGAVRMAEGHPVAERPEEVDPKRKAELLRVCDERARAAGLEVTQVSVGYAEERRLVEVFNSDGVAAADDRTRIRLAAQVVAGATQRAARGSRRAPTPAADTRDSSCSQTIRAPSASRRRARRSPCSTPSRLPRAGWRWWWATDSEACCCTRPSATGSRPTRCTSARASTPASSGSSWPNHR